MDPYVTGATIKALRERRKMTQAELAEKLHICAKTVSKWETGKGLPDITLLEPLAAACGVSVTELLSGTPIENTNVSGNLLKTVFYVCPICGNIITAVGEASITCHGIVLPPSEPEPADDAHRLTVEAVEDEWYLTAAHPMTKQHYLSFIAAVSGDRLRLIKLYPEGNVSVRIKRAGVSRLLFCCNQDGLFYQKIR